jgi:hypothetical protein
MNTAAGAINLFQHSAIGKSEVGSACSYRMEIVQRAMNTALRTALNPVLTAPLRIQRFPVNAPTYHELLHATIHD